MVHPQSQEQLPSIPTLEYPSLFGIAGWIQTQTLHKKAGKTITGVVLTHQSVTLC